MRCFPKLFQAPLLMASGSIIIWRSKIWIVNGTWGIDHHVKDPLTGLSRWIPGYETKNIKALKLESWK